MKRTLSFILTLLLVLSIPTASFAGYDHCDYHPNATKIWHDEISCLPDFIENPTHHRKVWSAYYTCSICGDYIGTGGDVYRDEMERHSFSGNTCTICGYRRSGTSTSNTLPTPEELQMDAIQLINKIGDQVIGRRAKILYAGNVRARANRNSAVIGSVYIDEEYEIIDYDFGTSDSVWLQVKHRNQYGWISASLVRIPDAEGRNPWDEWYIGQTCRITTSSGRARMAPGTSYPIVEYVGRNEEYTILDVGYAPDSTLWFQIQKDGNLCWISSGIATTN